MAPNRKGAAQESHQCATRDANERNGLIEENGLKIQIGADQVDREPR
jgi:hypothetical protein